MSADPRPTPPADSEGFGVLYLIAGLGPGGAELQARYLLTHLPAQGVAVRLGTFGGDDESVALVAKAGVPIHRLTPRPPVVWPARVVSEILGILRKHRIRLVHSCLPTFDILAPCLRAFDPGLKVITSRRSLDEYLSPRDLKRLRLTGRWATRIVGNSNEVAESVTRLEGFRPPALQVIPNGIPMPAPLSFEERAEARRRFDVGPDRFVVSFPAHFRRGKGHALIADVARRVRDAHPEAVFLLAGDMEVSDQYRRIAAETREAVARADLDSSVRFLGPVSDIRALQAASDVSLNLSDSEGMSNSVMEAMALGVPVVATGVGGNLEVIQEGVHGLHFPVRDAAAAAAALIRLAGDPALRARLGDAARQRVAAEYSIDRMVARYVSLYREVLAS
jgi:glycosyltransferase involved in cell wall biosynthesis